MAAELAARGHRFFTDDTLIFPATSSEENLLCYPGQRRLRLWRDALDRMGLPVGEAVRENRNTNKHYADAENRAPVSMAPLATLVILRKAEEKQAAPNSWRTLSGPEAVLAVAEHLSKPEFAEELLGKERLLSALKRLLEKVTVCEFTTRRSENDHDAAIEFVLDHVQDHQSEQILEED
ncbi:hypothetical protein [Aurantiacibacter sp. MUD61]|uniref:hypothetical protein n=1 Tax=Aurantiacibacter sp. MUD61 TaxID=3009083 RepID=UPI0022F0ACBC|nr:hypothetical protein [Aurantiacibacter sp. MUD61]